MIQNPEAGIVAYEGIFLGFVCLLGIGYYVNIEVVFVPFFYFIIRQELAPTINTFFCRFGQWVTTEPAVMNNFGYHKTNMNNSLIIFKFINCASSLPSHMPQCAASRVRYHAVSSFSLLCNAIHFINFSLIAIIMGFEVVHKTSLQSLIRNDLCQTTGTAFIVHRYYYTIYTTLYLA